MPPHGRSHRASDVTPPSTLFKTLPQAPPRDRLRRSRIVAALLGAHSSFLIPTPIRQTRGNFSPSEANTRHHRK